MRTVTATSRGRRCATRTLRKHQRPFLRLPRARLLDHYWRFLFIVAYLPFLLVSLGDVDYGNTWQALIDQAPGYGPAERTPREPREVARGAEETRRRERLREEPRWARSPAGVFLSISRGAMGGWGRNHPSARRDHPCTLS